MADEQVILPETPLDIIYPGSILKGNSIDDQSSIIPINPDSYTPMPIEVSATIAAKKVYGQIDPDLSSFENFKQTTLTQEVPSEQNMSLQLDIKTFMDYLIISRGAAPFIHRVCCISLKAICKQMPMTDMMALIR